MNPQELDKSIQALIDGTLPPEEFDALKTALKADPEAILSLGREGVQRVQLTVWSEERDEILRDLAQFAMVAEQARGNG